MKKLQKGFTLIELLVVIAIIGILSSVVLASLTSARTKGQDAAVQATLSNMRAQAELYYSGNGNSYGPTASVCTSGNHLFGATTSTALTTLIAGAESQNGTGMSLSCHSNATAWAVSSPMPSGSSTHFCVDSKGNALSTSSFVTSVAACN